jgi:hypothetical protein
MKKLEKPIEKPIDAYKEILALIEKCAAKVELDYSVSNSYIYSLKSLIEKEEVSEKFQIKVPNCSIAGNNGWYNLNNYEHIGLFGAKHKRTISWSDDGSQPEDEWLYVLSFSTGGYLFGEHYPKDLFTRFFRELKQYQPKYSDTANHTLYFTSDIAAQVHNDFPQILQRYKNLALVEEHCKAAKIEELREQLKTLEGM